MSNHYVITCDNTNREPDDDHWEDYWEDHWIKGVWLKKADDSSEKTVIVPSTAKLYHIRSVLDYTALLAKYPKITSRFPKKVIKSKRNEIFKSIVKYRRLQSHLNTFLKKVSPDAKIPKDGMAVHFSKDFVKFQRCKKFSYVKAVSQVQNLMKEQLAEIKNGSKDLTETEYLSKSLYPNYEKLADDGFDGVYFHQAALEEVNNFSPDNHERYALYGLGCMVSDGEALCVLNKDVLI